MLRCGRRTSVMEITAFVLQIPHATSSKGDHHIVYNKAMRTGELLKS